MKAHLIDTHLLVPRSRSSAKVRVKYQGHVSQKMSVSGALVFTNTTCLKEKNQSVFIAHASLSAMMQKLGHFIISFQTLKNCSLPREESLN